MLLESNCVGIPQVVTGLPSQQKAYRCTCLVHRCRCGLRCPLSTYVDKELGM